MIGSNARRFAAMAVLAGSCAFGVAPAHAQHMVTEAEAAKLTLAALTAPPPPPRPIWRSYVHRAMARGYVGGWRRESGSAGRWHGRAMTVASHHVVHRSGGARVARSHRRG